MRIDKISDYLSFVFNDKEIVGIEIESKRYDIISVDDAIKRIIDNGKVFFIYFTHNKIDNTYYIGKCATNSFNRARNYKGSGIKISNKIKAHSDNYERFIILFADSIEELRVKEQNIVTSTILNDEFCDNLIVGGGFGKNETNEDKQKRRKDKFLEKYNNDEKFRNQIQSLHKFGHKSELRKINQRKAFDSLYNNEKWYAEWYEKNKKSCEKRISEIRKHATEIQNIRRNRFNEMLNSTMISVINDNNEVIRSVSFASLIDYIKKELKSTATDHTIIESIKDVINGKSKKAYGFRYEYTSGKPPQINY